MEAKKRFMPHVQKGVRRAVVADSSVLRRAKRLAARILGERLETVEDADILRLYFSTLPELGGSWQDYLAVLALRIEIAQTQTRRASALAAEVEEEAGQGVQRDP